MIFNESIYNKHWNTKKLNELGTFNRGKSKHRPRNDLKLFKNGIYPFIQTGDIKNSILYISSHTQNYNEFGLAQSKLWNKGTLCITIASNIADTAVLAYPMCFPDSVVGFIANPTESSEIFMHYIFTYIQKYIQNSVIGSIQDNINIDYLQNLEFKIPSKEHQEKITLILSTLDKKIELNNKINSELENMAKTIYDYWFLQFEFPNDEGKPYKSSGGKMVWNEELKKEIPEGWYNKKIIDIANLYQPKTISEKSLNPKGKYLVFGANGIIGKYDEYNHINNEIAICCRGASCGKFIMTEPMSWITGNAMVVSPLTVEIGKEFIFYSLVYEKICKFITGSAQPQITRENLKNMSILIPNKEILEKFEIKAKSIRNKIQSNLKENRELTSLRDYLLPLLMNGQIGFKD